ncbi:MAG: hypothetical protein ACRDGL_03765 [Candidatus Limnocylindrales bacterium]
MARPPASGSGGFGAQAAAGRPGLRAQARRTGTAARTLAAAHLALLKAELGEISGQLKILAALAGMAFAAAVFLGFLVLIGGALFLGEWLFGSLGWGVLDGLLLSLGLIVALVLAILGVTGRLLGTSFAWAVVLGVVVAVVLGSQAIRQGAGQAATSLRLGLDPGWAPAVVAIVVGAVVLGLIGLLLGSRSGGGAALGGLLLGAILGALLGWFSGGIAFSRHGAAALGLTAGALAWPMISGLRAWRVGLDPAARFQRLWPRQSYEAARETKAYLEAEWAKRRNALWRR